MQKRALGKSGIEIVPLVFGGNVFGWTIDEATSFKILDQLVGEGLNCIDTADIYSTWTGQPGISETIIGKWLKTSGKRNQVVIATKLGKEMAPGKIGLSKKYMMTAVEDSLKRLQVETIDLYQSHDDDKNTPLEETMGAFEQLIKAGKVRAIGASNYTGDRLRQAIEVAKQKGFHTYQTLQPHYNLYDRVDYETHLESVCREHGLGVIPYFSLASGFLTGKYRSEADFSKSKRGGGMGRFLNERGFKILKALDQVSEQHRATQAQVALAWLMARPGITAPIASATTPEQLHDIAGALKLNLDAASIQLLNDASAI
ncbi:MAG: aldo/keto reductase [Bdellovibrionales bacterium]|nr:aldo/keto reductase [Bdellovibrionales bacterium]